MSLRMTKRMAKKVEFEDDEGRMVRYVRHPVGGGLVSPQARVHESATVAVTAYVEAGAQVGPRSRVGEGSWLDHDVVVGSDVMVAGNVHLGPRTRVGHRAWIGSGARIGSDVVIDLGVRIAPDSIVPDGTVVGRHDGSRRSAPGIAA
jgi:UDP-3-O-[3-hydroxymyristoyl] glucosamine N-acyltransferase